MNKTSVILVRKYARAFIGVFGNQLTVKNLESCLTAQQNLARIKQLDFFLKMPFISDQIKKDALASQVKTSGLPASFIALLDLLVEHKRTFLLGPILGMIRSMGMQLTNTACFTIASSDELTQQQYADLESFLHDRTGCTILTKKIIDPTLLAGIAMKSDTFAWEHSLKQYIRSLELLAHDLRT